MDDNGADAGAGSSVSDDNDMQNLFPSEDLIPNMTDSPIKENEEDDDGLAEEIGGLLDTENNIRAELEEVVDVEEKLEKEGGVYEELQWTRFDAVIRQLEKERRSLSQRKDGTIPSGNDDFFSSIFSIQGRALDRFIFPWLLCTLNALFWTIMLEENVVNLDKFYEKDNAVGTQTLLFTTLAFLLSFRSNRSILRFWTGAQAWNGIVVSARSLVMATLIHGRDLPYHRDQVVVWVAITVIAAKRRLRGFIINENDLQDLLSKDQIFEMNKVEDPSVYAANKVRNHLKLLFDVTKEFGPLSPARSMEMRMHEKHLDSLMTNVVASDNIVKSPVPLVFVAHLRSLLLIWLLSLPYLSGGDWGWLTIPIVSITSYMMLGVEGAAAEMECPFEKRSINDLDLDHYCHTIIMDIQELVKIHNERNKKRR